MRLLGKIFNKKQKDIKEFELGDGLFCNEKGEVYGEIQISTSFNEQDNILKFPINTTVEKLKEEYERNKANEANPNSCEREPNEDEIKIPVDDIYRYQEGLYEHPLRQKLSKAHINAIKNRYNNIIILKSEYEELLSKIQQRSDLQKLKNKVYEMLDKGRQLEKAGDIDSTIEVYQKVVDIDYNGVGYGQNKPYDRLMILYRKKKDVDNEIKTIEQAIKVLSEENNKRALSAIEKHPDKKEQILNAMEHCVRVMGDDVFFCFIPYDVTIYQDRLQKITKKTTNENNK